MAVVVTGASGFIGSHLVRTLAARGLSVVGVDRESPVAFPAEPVVADLPDDDADGRLAEVLREADAVFHLAASSGVRQTGARSSQRRHRDNVLATERVLTAVPASTPLVVTSSSAVYGGVDTCAASTAASLESDPLRPRGEYAASKLEAERRCAARITAGGLVAVARPFTVAGEGQRPDMAIAAWLAAVRAGQPLPMLGAAERTRDVTDVTDVAEGLVRCAERQVVGPVNLGTGEAHRLDTIAAAVGEAVGDKPEMVLGPAGPEEVAHTRADTRRCAAALGFVPRTDLATLVARQAAATGAAGQAATTEVARQAATAGDALGVV
jgi:nucleoside-diphosphate-sugar epimerase